MYLSEESKRQKLIEKGYLNLDRNENLDTILAKHINNFLKKRNTTLSYPSYTNFILKLSKFLKIKKENILLTNGCSEAIKISFNQFINKKTNLLVYYPTYMYALEIAKKLTSNITYINYKESPVEYIKNKKINFFYICNPNNPTGDFLSKKQLFQLIRLCKQYNCMVFVDEAYFEYCGISVLSFVKRFSNLLVGRTFSKAWGLAGERVGYVVAQQKIISKLNTLRLKASTPSLGVYLAEMLLSNYKIVQASIKRNIINRAFLKKYILAQGGTILNKDTTNFIYFKSKTNIFKNKQLILRKLYNNYCITVFSKKIAKKLLC